MPEILVENNHLQALDAVERIEWALGHLPDTHALSSSFGVQSAVSLHLLTQAKADIPVILIDTGYLFPETYQYIDQLANRLKLNLQVFKSQLSPAWLESRHGQLWNNGLEGIERYNQIMKVEPMKEALQALNVKTWFSGIRNVQSDSRSHKQILETAGSVCKFNPIVDWSDRDVFMYMKKHQLPQHPLWNKGYISIGDTHTTRPMTAELDADQVRFFGLKRECGIHEMSI
ncbi:phosphoadenylyl-sulfate reductase [Marinicella sp. W31]|uniref:phosphoadenylyl-sulfate reductase n=1 Tax=Marinicella sp. W31 TaxID=3023713 RepID=UPI003757395B